MSKPITQRQARENRKELNRLREVINSQRRGWVRDWPCSTIIGRLEVDAVTAAKIQTARTLRHAVVVTANGNTLALFALDASK